jgi:hypothetical protein
MHSWARRAKMLAMGVFETLLYNAKGGITKCVPGNIATRHVPWPCAKAIC